MTTPRKLSERYELGEILGFGGMSEVHLARDLRLSRDVAIKVLRADLARDPTFYLRFRREAQNAAALNHPAIVAVYDTGEAETDAGPLPYIVMEYVEGDTLRDIVRGKGPMAPRRAMEVIADVCAALDFSHRNGIVHRDMKPANIMINKSGAVKVMDFGIARAIADSSSPMTQTAAVIGTAQYLSPEQARGEQVDARSDVYSLGCVLYEILTGEPPFTGDSPVAVAYQHVREDPQLPSRVYKGVPRELDSVILKAMSKNPANRYQSAAEMRSDLVRVLGGQKPSAPMVMTDEDRTTIIGSVDGRARRYGAADTSSTSVTTHAKDDPDDEPPRSRRGLKIAALLVAALAIVAVVGAFLWKSGPGATTDQIAVPDLANKTSQAAQTALQNLGFRVDTTEKFDKVVAAGNVITTRPLAGSRVDEGSTISLDVSKGPEQVAVPKLDGMTQSQATQALTAVGLKLDPTVNRAASSSSEIDQIVEQDPSAGANIDVSTPVKITLGSGPAQIRVPNVVGQTIDVAQGNLEGAGFTVTVDNVASSKPKGEVIATSPSGGSSADQGATVKVQVSEGDKFTMPDLSNQTVSQALDTLKGAGWTGSATQLIQIPAFSLAPDSVGKVVTQQPPAGTQQTNSSPVTVGIAQLGIPR
ncbi:Stk1 family PASTA domain-containing Ser/Thr kinase [Antrihabitans cavernicola]|uniref:non-specific serine/threonine protein kinase n=1 Tax=Antrihabitans cavernicola TaxID=2495913 RepID=A0A5A7SKD6_9NOCA|nr:Stk1 family PASTA domain-containing Ser/Thr kinase [Spelaeibacter cavernicola]KAA0024925.1 Stk1 family PASTA domain-containing Ser/Thr kinase [Spelaeibacter cavernicola]